jgi:hypothetical protein
MTAKIYKPARNAMQSGKGKTGQWLLEFEPDAPLTADPVMGWTSSADTASCLRYQGASHRLCRERGHCLLGRARAAGAHAAQGLFRQFQMGPARQLDALVNDPETAFR